ncbi:Helicase conserved C-terminal domain [Ceratobasidium sp. AG-Ba]|nr:Helicase conserved C-terminal domain [Ceratobasidium sp. AG-Ba]
MPIHAWMTPNYRSKAMAKFASGKVQVIIATEAAGMPLLLKGCNILNIKRVIQFGVCGSIGFNRSKMLSCNGMDELGVAPTVLAKKLVTENVYRQKFLNQVYSNPTRDSPVPPHECCDLCDSNSAPQVMSHKFPPRKGAPRAARVSGESNPDMLSCLLAWRKATFPSIFGRSSLFGAPALISDDELERISRCAPVCSIEQLRSYLIKWRYVDTQLPSMWEALQTGGFTSTIKCEDVTSVPERPRKVRVGARASAKQLRSSAQASPTDIWWREEQNYEVHHSTLDNLRRHFAGTTESKAHEEPVQSARPSKRSRLDNNAAIPQISPSAPSTPHVQTSLKMVPRVARPTFQPPARPVGRLIVPSQRPVLHAQRFNTHPRLQPIGFGASVFAAHIPRSLTHPIGLLIRNLRTPCLMIVFG